MTLFDRGLSMLTRVAAQAAGVSATFCQDDQTVDLMMVRGQSSFTSEMGESFDTVDWICAAAELLLGGVPALPLIGAVVQIPVPNGYEKYEVLKIPGRKPYSVDATRMLLRIHTKQVS